MTHWYIYVYKLIKHPFPDLAISFLLRFNYYVSEWINFGYHVNLKLKHFQYGCANQQCSSLTSDVYKIIQGYFVQAEATYRFFLHSTLLGEKHNSVFFVHMHGHFILEITICLINSHSIWWCMRIPYLIRSNYYLC